jgi:hypothetical protein
VAQEVLHMGGVGAVPDHPGRAGAPEGVRRGRLLDPRGLRPPTDDLADCIAVLRLDGEGRLSAQGRSQAGLPRWEPNPRVTFEGRTAC